MKMRPSRVLKKLRAGQFASCVKINLRDGRSSEVAAMCGFDCVWLDMEHVACEFSTLDSHILATKVHDVDIIVRVPKGCYSDYIKPLESDATGVMIPHMMSAEEARQTARQTKFQPIGLRPVDGGNPDGAYCMMDPMEYVKQANSQRFVIVQIEDPEPMAELEEIIQVEGIDMLFFGPGDYSQAIGKFGQWDDPAITEARKEIARVARKHNKAAGTTAPPDRLNEFIDMGYNFVSVGADVLGLWKYYREIVAALP